MEKEMNQEDYLFFLSPIKKKKDESPYQYGAFFSSKLCFLVHNKILLTLERTLGRMMSKSSAPTPESSTSD